MRPLLVDLGRHYRGGQHQAFLLLQGLRERGHSAQLIAIGGSRLARRAQDCGVAVHGVSDRRRRIGAMQAIRKLVSAGEIDLVHANEPHALTAAWLARAHRNVPLVVSRRVIFPIARGAVSQARYRAAAAVIAVSQYVAQQVAASGIVDDQVVVIPDGVVIPPPRSMAARMAARGRLGIPATAPLVGCIAAFTPDKGQDLLIQALSRLRARFAECQLLLVGQGPRYDELTGLAAEEKLDHAVRFMTLPEDLSEVYEAMDVFAFPAQAEALGTALLSAMAHGLPCVALARGGIPEAIQDGVNGVLIQQARAEEMAMAVEKVLANSAEAQRLSAAARATITECFSADRMVDATLRLYTQVTTRK